jgi:hypothetical protein
MDRSSGGFHSFHKNLLCAAFKEIDYPLVSAMSDTIVVSTTVPCIGILRPSKMPENSKMTWNNYRSGKETGSWSSIPRSAK